MTKKEAAKKFLFDLSITKNYNMYNKFDVSFYNSGTINNPLYRSGRITKREVYPEYVFCFSELKKEQKFNLIKFFIEIGKNTEYNIIISNRFRKMLNYFENCGIENVNKLPPSKRNTLGSLHRVMFTVKNDSTITLQFSTALNSIHESMSNEFPEYIMEAYNIMEMKYTKYGLLH